MTEAPLLAVLRGQARACAELGSPFTARLLLALAEELTPEGPLGLRLFGWEGDLSGSGASVPLRLAGALHALVLSGAAPALATAYPSGAAAPAPAHPSEEADPSPAPPRAAEPPPARAQPPVAAEPPSPAAHPPGGAGPSAALHPASRPESSRDAMSARWAADDRPAPRDRTAAPDDPPRTEGTARRAPPAWQDPALPAPAPPFGRSPGDPPHFPTPPAAPRPPGGAAPVPAASLSPGPDDLRPALRAALRDHAAAIDRFLDSPPQTSEVARSAVLIAAAHWLHARHPLPLRLSELGASAGLNLRFDAYALQAGATRLGPGDAPLLLAPDWEGPVPAPAPVRVLERRGVDLAPIDPAQRLRAYVWPDQPERLARLDAALALPPAPVDRGDAAAWLARRLAGPRPGTLHLVFHTVAWQYFPPATRAACLAALEEAGARATPDAPLARLAFESDGQGSGGDGRTRGRPDAQEPPPDGSAQRGRESGGSGGEAEAPDRQGPEDRAMPPGGPGPGGQDPARTGGGGDDSERSGADRRRSGGGPDDREPTFGGPEHPDARRGRPRDDGADGEAPPPGAALTLWPGGRTYALGRADFHDRWTA